MDAQRLHVEEVKTGQDLEAFIRLPWNIYQGDPHWVPPLIKDQRAKLAPTHPFHSHSEMILLVAKKQDRAIGRIAGIIDHNYNAFHQEKIGFFGFFESPNDTETSETLLSKACEWLKDHGMETMVGPVNPSTNDECGLLVDGFDAPPCLMMPYNPPYYASLLEGAGLKKVMDLYAYWLDESTFLFDRLNRITKRICRKSPPIHIRPLNLRRFDDELKIIKEIYNDAWSRNWGFVPLTEAEIDDLARNLRPLVVPELILLAYWEGEPIGFSVALPDYNFVLKHLDGKVGLIGTLKFLYYSRKIHTVRVMLLGVKRAFQKKGIEGLLYLETCKKGIGKGYYQSECSWILESNPLMQHGLEAMGGRRYKTYRIYEMPI
jgi:hypothetical protein